MNTLEQHVLEIIGESTSSPDVFLDTDAGIAPIRDSLNDAIEEICMATGCRRRRFLVPLKNGITFYRIDESDYTDRWGWPVSVWLTGVKRRLVQKDLIWLRANIPTWLKGTGNPVYYGLVGLDSIWVYPTPASDSYTLDIDGVSIPKRYAMDTDRIQLADQYKWAAVHYAVSEFWASRGDAKSATDHHMKFLDLVKLKRFHPMQPERQWGYKMEAIAR